MKIRARLWNPDGRNAFSSTDDNFLNSRTRKDLRLKNTILCCQAAIRVGGAAENSHTQIVVRYLFLSTEYYLVVEPHVSFFAPHGLNKPLLNEPTEEATGSHSRRETPFPDLASACASDCVGGCQEVWENWTWWAAGHSVSYNMQFTVQSYVHRVEE